MASLTIRDPKKDHLLTPENSVLVMIDYQPVQVSSVASRDRQSLVRNVVSVAKGAKLFGLPVIISTVNVESGRNKPTIHQLTEIFPEVKPIDRSTINAWEDSAFVEAVKSTRRNKIILVALWTEACMIFPTLDALKEGFEVYPVVDAIGGTSLEAHNTALKLAQQAGAKPISWVQLLCELQRDWNRTKTAVEFGKILFSVEGL